MILYIKILISDWLRAVRFFKVQCSPNCKFRIICENFMRACMRSLGSAQWRKSWRGGGGGGVPPPTFDSRPKRGLKTVFSSANGGGGVCRKFESFVGNLGGFVPPPENVNFRHWVCYSIFTTRIILKSKFTSAGGFSKTTLKMTCAQKWKA